MRIFEDQETWGGKINFVDINDVLIGFDAYQSCCESFGYEFTLTGEKEAEAITEPANLEHLVFDTKFFREHDGYDAGGIAVFRLFDGRFQRPRNDRDTRQIERELQQIGGHREVFLHLYNHHNGYYGHGFEMTHSGQTIQSGCI